MKDSSINIPPGKNVNLRPEDICRADMLAMDERTIMALVDIIFSQRESPVPPS